MKDTNEEAVIARICKPWSAAQLVAYGHVFATLCARLHDCATNLSEWATARPDKSRRTMIKQPVCSHGYVAREPCGYIIWQVIGDVGCQCIRMGLLGITYMQGTCAMVCVWRRSLVVDMEKIWGASVVAFVMYHAFEMLVSV